MPQLCSGNCISQRQTAATTSCRYSCTGSLPLYHCFTIDTSDSRLQFNARHSGYVLLQSVVACRTAAVRCCSPVAMGGALRQPAELSSTRCGLKDALVRCYVPVCDAIGARFKGGVVHVLASPILATCRPRLEAMTTGSNLLRGTAWLAAQVQSLHRRGQPCASTRGDSIYA